MAAPSPTKPSKLFRTLSTILTSRSGLAALAGQTFGGKRDLYTALGYKPQLSTSDFRSRYERDGISKRIIESFPDATWRGGAELIEDEDPNTETKFEAAWNEFAERLQVWSVFRRADILAGLGQYAIVLIGGPGEDLQQPLVRASADQIVFLSPYSQEDAAIAEYVTDIADPRFGLPNIYKLKRIGGAGELAAQSVVPISSRPGLEKPVHWTRVLHVADGLLDDLVFGQPRLRPVWNRLDDLDKVTGGGAEAFWKRADQGMQLNIDPTVDLDPEDITALQAEVDEYIHGNRRIMRTRGVEVNPLGSDVANFGPPAEALIAQISAATGIPKRLLMGSEQGELASSQDKGNWDDRVQDRRTGFAAPQIVLPFVERLIAMGALPNPTSFQVKWPEIEELDESQKADVAMTIARANQAQGQEIITSDEIRDMVYGLEPLDTTQLDQQQDTTGGADAGAVNPESQPAQPQARAAASSTLLYLKKTRNRRLSRARTRYTVRRIDLRQGRTEL